MALKYFRLTAGGLLTLFGLVFFVLPGSMLCLIAGLVLLSYDVPQAKQWLTASQRSMSRGARRLDRFLLNRKLRRGA